MHFEWTFAAEGGRWKREKNAKSPDRGGKATVKRRETKI